MTKYHIATETKKYLNEVEGIPFDCYNNFEGYRKRNFIDKFFENTKVIFNVYNFNTEKEYNTTNWEKVKNLLHNKVYNQGHLGFNTNGQLRDYVITIPKFNNITLYTDKCIDLEDNLLNEIIKYKNLRKD